MTSGQQLSPEASYFDEVAPSAWSAFSSGGFDQHFSGLENKKTLRLLMPGAGFAPGLPALVASLKKQNKQLKAVDVVLVDPFLEDCDEYLKAAVKVSDVDVRLKREKKDFLDYMRETQEGEKFDIVFFEHPELHPVMLVAPSAQAFREGMLFLPQRMRDSGVVLVSTHFFWESWAARALLGLAFDVPKERTFSILNAYQLMTIFCIILAAIMDFKAVSVAMGLLCFTFLPDHICSTNYSNFLSLDVKKTLSSAPKSQEQSADKGLAPKQAYLNSADASFLTHAAIGFIFMMSSPEVNFSLSGVASLMMLALGLEHLSGYEIRDSRALDASLLLKFGVFAIAYACADAPEDNSPMPASVMT